MQKQGVAFVSPDRRRIRLGSDKGNESKNVNEYQLLVMLLLPNSAGMMTKLCMSNIKDVEQAHLHAIVSWKETLQGSYCTMISRRKFHQTTW